MCSALCKVVMVLYTGGVWCELYTWLLLDNWLFMVVLEEVICIIRRKV